MRARAKKTRSSRYKSGIEERRAAYLQGLKLAGEIHDWRYEPWSFRIGDKARYRPDFMVIRNDGTIWFEEDKGHHQNLRASRVAFKSAAEQYPWFDWVWVTEKKGGGWNDAQVP